MRSQSPLPVDSKDVPFHKYKVVFRYTPQHDDELSINEGDLITVLHEVEEGWWKGVLNGQVGMFPSNFVEKIEEPRSGTKTNELNGNADGTGIKDQSRSSSVSPDVQFSAKIVGSANSAFHPIQSKREERESKKEGPDVIPNNKLETSQLSKGTKMNSNSVETNRAPYEKDKVTINIIEEINKKEKDAQPRNTPTSLDATPPQLPPKPVRELARVVFPYTADHDDELELNDGDIITVLCKELEDKGWWKGEINNRVGVFPDNFVELITVEEAVKPPRPEKRPTALPKPKHPPDTLPTKKKAPSPGTQSLKKSPSVSVTKKAETKTSIGSDLSKDSIDGNESLSLDREHHLIHHTHTRPKGPSNRRPPSQSFLDEKKTSFSEDEEMNSLAEELVGDKLHNSANSSTAEVPWMKELKANQMKKKLMGNTSVDSPLPSTLDSSFVQAKPRRSSDLTPPTKVRTSTSSSKIDTTPANSSAVSTNGFKEESFSGKVEYDAIINKLRAEFSPLIKKLEERLYEQQQRHSRQLLMLMDELGEERQKIACLQIDIDRLTKLSSSDAHV